jgi:hypothetical protein
LLRIPAEQQTIGSRQVTDPTPSRLLVSSGVELELAWSTVLELFNPSAPPTTTHISIKMAAHVEVVSTDFRRVKVKVTPGTYLVDVLGEACTKLNLKSDKYELK